MYSMIARFRGSVELLPAPKSEHDQKSNGTEFARLPCSHWGHWGRGCMVIAPSPKIASSSAILCTFQRLSASTWVLKLKIPCRRGLESRCYTSLVHGTLRIRVRNSRSCMLAVSSTSFAELRLCHTSWTAAQQTQFQYQSAESPQHFPMDEPLN